MNMSQIIGKNIVRYKEKLGLSNEVLGDILGVTRQTFAKYITGEQVIDSVKLFTLAKFFNVPVKAFLEDTETALHFMFRADNPRDNFDQDTALKVNRRLLSYCNLVKLVEGSEDVFIPENYRLTTSVNKLSKEDKEKIREIAEKQRLVLGLDDDEDIYRILEDHGINIYAASFNINVDALSAFSEEHGSFILINDKDEIPEERKRFSCAHELGHLILHRDDYKRNPEDLEYYSSRADIREKMANVFASYLLIPRASLHKEYKKVVGKRKFITIEDICLLKKRFFVSAHALILALMEEKLIKPPLYGYFNKVITEEYGNSEPEPMEKIEKNKRLFTTLRNLAIDEEITTNKVAEMLDLNIHDSRRLMKTWVSDKGINIGHD